MKKITGPDFYNYETPLPLYQTSGILGSNAFTSILDILFEFIQDDWLGHEAIHPSVDTLL